MLERSPEESKLLFLFCTTVDTRVGRIEIFWIICFRKFIIFIAQNHRIFAEIPIVIIKHMNWKQQNSKVRFCNICIVANLINFYYKWQLDNIHYNIIVSLFMFWFSFNVNMRQFNCGKIIILVVYLIWVSFLIKKNENYFFFSIIFDDLATVHIWKLSKFPHSTSKVSFNSAFCSVTVIL